LLADFDYVVSCFKVGMSTAGSGLRTKTEFAGPKIWEKLGEKLMGKKVNPKRFNL
jgi:hypothetical protein